jgi:hypothetical protein
MLPSAIRKTIPVGYQVCSLRLDGETPLLMSSAECDRESDLYRSYEQLSKTRAKSDEDKKRLRELEWYTRLYFDEEIGPFVPGKNVKEMLRSAATKFKSGEIVRRSLVIPEYRIPLIYEGPRTAEELWKDNFRYTTMVANAGAGSGRVERTRPCFDRWAIECEIAFDPSELDMALLLPIVERSEKYGLGDYRPEFGAFHATVTHLFEQREDTRASAVKPRDKRAEKAVKAHAERVKVVTA